MVAGNCLALLVDGDTIPVDGDITMKQQHAKIGMVVPTITE